jgi:carbamate kinase
MAGGECGWFNEVTLKVMTAKSIIVVAIGGNGICPSEPGAEMTFTAQLIHTKRTLWNLISLFNEFQVVITHGNGPQAGLVYEQMIPRTPFGVVTLVTTSQISSAITRAYEELITENNLQGLPPMEPVLSWVKVDPHDPGFSNPSKPVGQQLSAHEVAELLRYHPEYLFTDYGKGKRRLIASPQPQEILNLTDIREVMEDGKVPVALGGGGIPVLLDNYDRREITDGILDKDLSSALLASNLAADYFLILTNEQGVFTGYSTPSKRFHPQIRSSQVQSWLAEGEFPPGSMGPKVEAALQFLAANPNGRVIVGNVEERAGKLLEGRSGTTITAG